MKKFDPDKVADEQLKRKNPNLSADKTSKVKKTDKKNKKEKPDKK